MQKKKGDTRLAQVRKLGNQSSAKGESQVIEKKNRHLDNPFSIRI